MRIALHAFNDNPGSPVLVFGGALGTRIPLWSAVASRLVDDHQIFLSDLPGHTFPAAAGDLESGFTVSDLAAGLVESLGELGVESFAYCGASISGAIGLTLALEHPTALTGLIACATATSFGTSESWESRIAEVESGGTRALLPDTADRWFAAGFLEEDIATGPTVLSDLATVDDAAYIACCRALAGYDLGGALAGITTPTLFMAGTQDPGCTPETMGQMRDAVESAQLAVIPDSAHLLMVEHPEFVADRIHAFVTEL